MGYILYLRVILAFRGLFLPEKRLIPDMICCPSAVNKCPFKRAYYFIFGKKCLVFGNIICYPFRMYCLAPYTVPLGPKGLLLTGLTRLVLRDLGLSLRWPCLYSRILLGLDTLIEEVEMKKME